MCYWSSWAACRPLHGLVLNLLHIGSLYPKCPIPFTSQFPPTLLRILLQQAFLASLGSSMCSWCFLHTQPYYMHPLCIVPISRMYVFSMTDALLLFEVRNLGLLFFFWNLFSNKCLMSEWRNQMTVHGHIWTQIPVNIGYAKLLKEKKSLWEQFWSFFLNIKQAENPELSPGLCSSTHKVPHLKPPCRIHGNFSEGDKLIYEFFSSLQLLIPLKPETGWIK